MKIATRVRRLDEIGNELDTLRGRRGSAQEYNRKSTLYRLRKKHVEALNDVGFWDQVAFETAEGDTLH